MLESPHAVAVAPIEAPPFHGHLGDLGRALSGLHTVTARPRRLDGDVAVALRTHRNVLVARRPFAAGPIVVGVDFSDRSFAAARTAEAIATGCQSRVVVVHALPHPPPGETRPETAERTQAARFALSAGSRRDSDVRIAFGDAWEVLVRAERELGASLLVLAGKAGRRIGDVVTSVVSAATGPVLVLRD